MDMIETQGITLPRLGFGTFRMRGGGCQPVVECALAIGYRHIDTAAMYENEDAVGAAIAAAGISRNELHVTTKVWHSDLQAGGIRPAFEQSLSKLKLDYVDMYMVHWPAYGMNLPDIFEPMQTLLDARLVRAIGVCNFTMPLLKKTIEEVGAPIACNQVEYHPFLDQSPMLAYLRSKGIPLTAYAPLAQGRAASDPVLGQIGTKHGVSAAQVALAWLLDQEGVIAIPKAQRPESQKANFDAQDIKLDDEDRHAIAALPKNQRFVNPPFAPRWDA